MLGNRLFKANRIADRASKDTERWYFIPDLRVKGMLRKTRCFCSCWMCGHQREHEGITRQEKKQILSEFDG